MALALVAAVIVRWKQPAFLERQRILDQERAEFELRRYPRSTSKTYLKQHGVPPIQDAGDLRPQQGSQMTTQNSGSEDFGTRIVMTGATSTDLEADQSHGLHSLLRNCPTL